MNFTDNQFNIAFGLGQLAPNARGLSINGLNPNIGVNDEDVWGLGGTYVFQTSAQPLELVSSDGNDTGAGTGAQSVLVRGLNANGDEIESLVIPTGVVPVALAVPFFRVNSMGVITSGSNGNNVGNLTLSVAGGGDPQGFIAAGRGISQSTIFTIPRGFSAVPGTLYFASRPVAGIVSGGNITTYTFWMRPNVSNTWVALAEFLSNDFVSTQIIIAEPLARSFGELSDIRISASCPTVATRGTFAIRGYIVKNGVDFSPCYLGECSVNPPL